MATDTNSLLVVQLWFTKVIWYCRDVLLSYHISIPSKKHSWELYICVCVLGIDSNWTSFFFFLVCFKNRCLNIEHCYSIWTFICCLSKIEKVLHDPNFTQGTLWTERTVAVYVCLYSFKLHSLYCFDKGATSLQFWSPNSQDKPFGGKVLFRPDLELTWTLLTRSDAHVYREEPAHLDTMKLLFACLFFVCLFLKKQELNVDLPCVFDALKNLCSWI